MQGERDSAPGEVDEIEWVVASSVHPTEIAYQLHTQSEAAQILEFAEEPAPELPKLEGAPVSAWLPGWLAQEKIIAQMQHALGFTSGIEVVYEAPPPINEVQPIFEEPLQFVQALRVVEKHPGAQHVAPDASLGQRLAPDMHLTKSRQRKVVVSITHLDGEGDVPSAGVRVTSALGESEGQGFTVGVIANVEFQALADPELARRVKNAFRHKRVVDGW